MKNEHLYIAFILSISLLFTNCSSNDEQENIEDEIPITYSIQSPFYPIDFEENGFGADWTWTVFENGENPSVQIVNNPVKSGLNTSEKVAEFTALTNGAQWAGFESKHGADIGSFTFDETNKIVKMLVFKSIISDVGLKFAESNGEAQPEVKVANTKINEWEELVFDMSNSIGKEVTKIDQIIIFPDFGDRSNNNVIYIDKITFGGIEE